MAKLIHQVTFVRLEKSIDPVELVHRLCADAHANPESKKSRWIKRMTPVTSARKTLSVDLESFAREILKPHFHSGGPALKVRRGLLFLLLGLVTIHA